MYTMCPPGYYHNGFMATPELGHRMYGYTLLDCIVESRECSNCEQWAKQYANCEHLLWGSPPNPKSAQTVWTVSIIYKCIQCALPVITIMALWQLLNLGTGCTVTHCWIALWSHESAQTASSERSNMPIVNTSYEALHPIQRVLKLYEQWA